MDSCVFCQIVNKELPARVEYESDQALAFHDIHPSAPTHVLVIPKKHITSADAVSDEDMQAVWGVHKVVAEVAKKLKITDGYKVVANGGKCQDVKHLHYHLLSGFTDPDTKF